MKTFWAVTIAVVWFLAGMTVGAKKCQAALYLSLTGGESFATSELQPDPPGTPYSWAPFKTNGSTEPTIRAAIGLHFGRFDVELGAGDLGRYSQSRDLSVCGSGCDVTGYGIMFHEIDLRGRYWQPITSKLSAYGELGIARVTFDQEQWSYPAWGFVSAQGTDIAGQYGAGLGYQLSPHWSVQGGALFTPVHGVNVWNWNVGVRYEF
jgi:opacity protein-like surface antigen